MFFSLLISSFNIRFVFINFLISSFNIRFVFIMLSHFHDTNHGFDKLTRFTQVFFLINFCFSISSFNIRLIEN